MYIKPNEEVFMLKKILIIVAVLLVCAGLGYLGYVIFMAKNIDKVELVGNVQTVYFVGDEFDYENAELKITYKNGDMKLLKLKDTGADIDLFTTSGEKHNKMKITYKNNTIEVEYDVLEKGYYFIDKEVTTSGSNEPVTNNYKYNTTKTIIDFMGNGKIRYYQKYNNGHTNGSDKWFMNDGVYDSSYNYNIVGSDIIVNLGDKNITLKSNYANGHYLSSSEVIANESNPNAQAQIKEKTYSYYGIMNGRKLMIDNEKSDIDYAVSGLSTNYLILKKNHKLNDTETKVYLHIYFTNSNSTDLFEDVYVEIRDEMNKSEYPIGSVPTYNQAFVDTDIVYGVPELEGHITKDLSYTFD